jgi:hypothetical protein
MDKLLFAPFVKPIPSIQHQNSQVWEEYRSFSNNLHAVVEFVR